MIPDELDTFTLFIQFSGVVIDIEFNSFDGLGRDCEDDREIIDVSVTFLLNPPC